MYSTAGVQWHCPLTIFLIKCKGKKKACQSLQTRCVKWYRATCNWQNKGNTTHIKCLNRALGTTSQNSFNKPWQKLYKCLELYWRDATPFFHEKVHHLVFCWWWWKMLSQASLHNMVYIIFMLIKPFIDYSCPVDRGIVIQWGHSYASQNNCLPRLMGC
jgi:hypothetical protein